MRERHPGAVVDGKARDGDKRVVHPTRLRPPRKLSGQGVEELAGPREPARAVVDPGTRREGVTTDDADQLTELRLIVEVEKRPLKGKRHGSRLPEIAHMYE
jgi:hypothetical protein